MAARDTEIEELKTQLREREISAAESIRETEALKHDLEDARSGQHRLEDEIAILQHEIEQLNYQIRENEKSRVESQILAESEVTYTQSTANDSARTTLGRK